MTRFADRRRKLLRNLRASEADVFLISHVPNVRYLTGFTGDSTFLLLSREFAMVISDTRYTVQLSEECPDLETYIRDSKEHMKTSLAKVLKQRRVKSLGFESHATTVDGLQSYREECDSKGPKTLEWVATPGEVEKLRMIKDKTEIAEIRQAVRIAERGMEFLRSWITPETSELEAAHELEHTMRRLDAEAAGFEPIVAVGPRAALPHARPWRYQMHEHPIVLVDWGAKTHGGYRSDLTRVLVTGKVPAKVRKMYDVVLKAQKTGIAKMAPGVAAKDVDAAARKVIEKAGFGKYFGHGLGHGIGLDIHEEPRMSALSEITLEAGMIITVEPGIYIPGYAGIRIEDDVLITKDGHEVLSNVPKEFDQMSVAM